MKPDIERKKRYTAPLHKKRKFLNVNVSKELRINKGIKSRALLVKKGDKVKIMRGKGSGKTANVASVDYNKTKVYLEGMTNRNKRGMENLIPFEPSNLQLIEIKEKGKSSKEVKETIPSQVKKPDSSYTRPNKLDEHKENKEKEVTPAKTQEDVGEKKEE